MRAANLSSAEGTRNTKSAIRNEAEAMMAYTKNNMLIQSAQANQVPQSVLQLLQ